VLAWKETFLSAGEEALASNPRGVVEDEKRRKPTPGLRTMRDGARLSDVFAPQPTTFIPGQGIVLVLAGGESCPVSRSLERVLKSMEPELEGAGVRLVTHPVKSFEKMHSFSTPWMLLYEDGELLDVSRGGFMEGTTDWEKSNRELVQHLLGRSGATEGRPLLREPIEIVFRRKGMRNATVENTDFSGVGFDGVEYAYDSFSFSSSVLSGAMFDGVSLRGADLSNTIAAHADFSGADLTDANLTDSLWVQSICPNGAMSQDHGNSCACCRTP